jgi:rod shape-determining protein MreD
MRIAAQVLLAYALVLLLGCLWRHIPLGRAAPDVVALSAVYLGLTARQQVAPATLGAVIAGYLGDLLIGTPRGLLSLTAGIVCISGHLVHRRLIVRGLLFTCVFSFFIGLLSQILITALRFALGQIPPGVGIEPWVLLGSALLTGAVGPIVLRLCRKVDARFARTYRERDAIDGGIT